MIHLLTPEESPGISGRLGEILSPNFREALEYAEKFIEVGWLGSSSNIGEVVDDWSYQFDQLDEKMKAFVGATICYSKGVIPDTGWLTPSAQRDARDALWITKGLEQNIDQRLENHAQYSSLAESDVGKAYLVPEVLYKDYEEILRVFSRRILGARHDDSWMEKKAAAERLVQSFGSGLRVMGADMWDLFRTEQLMMGRGPDGDVCWPDDNVCLVGTEPIKGPDGNDQLFVYGKTDGFNSLDLLRKRKARIDLVLADGSLAAENASVRLFMMA
ncbi:MAG: hypothetical protein LBK50_02875 [Candidatus Nomurabacteria bacterium]|jgi:hypothetical protein|nr:hypothetical protein [Candidatus Nomurabacteria bacterium]